MPMLGNYAKNTLGQGSHVVKITRYSTKQRRSGSEALILGVVTADGDAGEISFGLMESMFWKLHWFASACGLSKEQIARYNTDDPESHSVLIGHVVRVVFETNDRGYLDAKKFIPATESEIVAFQTANQSHDEIPY